MSDFRATLMAAGLRPREVMADGKLRRCATDAKPAKRNGWYILRLDGRGMWGDNQVAPRQVLGHWKDERAEAMVVSPKVQAQMAAQRQQEREYRTQAMRRARQFWHDSYPLNRTHPYIEKKGLTPLGCAGLRTNDGLLVVPVWHGEWIISVQTIAPDGAKRFWPGAPVKAGAYVLERQRAALTAIVEGLATGLAIFQSVRVARVVVAFDAGNLLPVVDRIRPSGSVVICGDNDWKTALRINSNPGIEKARNAAELIGCGVAFPEGIEGSDFADMLREIGDGAARKVERIVLAGARYVAAKEPVP